MTKKKNKKLKKRVIAWRCGCSKTLKAINYSKKLLKKKNNKVVYAVPTIQVQKEIKRKLDAVMINSKDKATAQINAKILKDNETGWKKLEMRNELLKDEQCLLVTHARLMITDPSDFNSIYYFTGSKDVIIDEFAMKLKKFYIQRATLLAYLVHPHYEMPTDITYENDFDMNHRRRENDWQVFEDDMWDNQYKLLHRVHISDTLLKNELKEMFPDWYVDFINDCKKDRIWQYTFDIYKRLCLTYRRTYAMKSETESDPKDYSRWLWLPQQELKENGLDLSDIYGNTFSMLDNYKFRWEGQLYARLKKVYKLFNYQKNMTYTMLQIARQIARDQYFDTDRNDNHLGYYVGGVNPLERWFIQHTYNVTCLDGSATLFKDIYKHYGFRFVNKEEKDITHYADNLECRVYNFKSFSQTSIQNMTVAQMKRMFLEYVMPYQDWARCWYVIVPMKCTEVIYKTFCRIYGKEYVCDCTTTNRTYIDEDGIEQQLPIRTELLKYPKARFILVNHEGQIGSNEFKSCDGVMVLSQLNLPNNINKIYSEYYGVENYSDLYSAHTIYQESARSSARLMKPINYKEGHKIPFIALLGMNQEQYKIFNRLGTDKKIFDKSETTNLKRIRMF